ncbi:MAG: response regulator [Sterolibacterium sp.]
MKKWRLLVVDNDQPNLNFIADILDDPCFKLDIAHDAGRALQMLETSCSAYDLIILDRIMPGMDGIELLHKIKAERRFRRIPVILQTAASVPQPAGEGSGAGVCCYYLDKPCAPAALLAVVRDALANVEKWNKQNATAQRTRQFSAALGLLRQAEFRYATLGEADSLVCLLAALCPDPERASIGLSELLVNAIEHGNLGIGYAEKSRLNSQGRWLEEVERRLALPEYRDLCVTVGFRRTDREIRFTIADQGKGFAWQDYLKIDPAQVLATNGRGIGLAKLLSFSSMEYQGCGNVVVATVANSRP